MRRTSLGSEMEAEAVSVMTFNVRYDEESDGRIGGPEGGAM